jgi:hypothetical protein
MPGIEDLQNKMSEKSLTNFLNTDSKQIIFGIEAQINNLMGEYEMAVRNGEMEKAKILNDKINELDKMKIDIANQSGRTMSNIDSGRTISDIDRQGRTISDIDLQGRTISDIDRGGRTMSNMDRQMIKGYAEGDEVSMMMMELEGDEDGMQEEAMKELEAARPEFEMMQQLAQVVINLIEQGASEAEIVAILKEQGLDDEDIQTLLEFVNEMMGQAEQGGMAEDDIGSQLQGMM